MNNLKFVTKSNLDEAANIIFDNLEVKNFQKRFSDNYPPHGYYYTGTSKNGIRVDVAQDDTEGNEDFTYFISVYDDKYAQEVLRVLRGKDLNILD